jgi:ribosomal protein L37E
MLPNSHFITINDNRTLVSRFLEELIITPKHLLKEWAVITKQTPAAKIGYIGQHLASLLTGVKGTGTGARGDDLADGSEVKSCNKIDQVDKCKECGARVLRMENVCSSCGSTKIQRKDDSKWLFSVRSEQELNQYLEMDRIVLILMDYPRFKQKDYSDIRICAFEIYPREKRSEVFRTLISNHYYNIYRKKADAGKKTNPMNLHPWKIQFYKCNPIKTFECIIKDVDGNAELEIKKYVEPNVERNAQMEAEPMPTSLLNPDEWKILSEGKNFKRIKPFLKDKKLNRQEFAKLTKKGKEKVLPYLNEELRNLIPLRDIVSTTQSTQYHRT